MKKIIILTVTLFALTACCPKRSEEVKASSNSFYTVEKLFTVDGITVYRFCDNSHTVYFTNRASEVKYSYSKREGKVTKTENIQTLCNDEQETSH